RLGRSLPDALPVSARPVLRPGCGTRCPPSPGGRAAVAAAGRAWRRRHGGQPARRHGAGQEGGAWGAHLHSRAWYRPELRRQGRRGQCRARLSHGGTDAVMTADLWLALGTVLICLILSAFFSGSETALTAASRARMHALEKSGDAKAGIVNRLLSMRERLIGSILIGNNVVNILA